MLGRSGAAAAVAATSGLGAAALTLSVQRLLASGITSPDDAVAIAVQAVGVLVLGWYLLTATGALVCLALRAAGTVWSGAELGVARLGAPLARRLLVTGTGAVVAAAAVMAPATAAPIEPSPEPTSSEVGDDLGWGSDDEPASPEPDASPSVDAEPTPEATTAPPAESPTTEQPTESPTTDPAEPSEPTAPQPPSGPGTVPASGPDDEGSYTVAVGDSLWEIAADHLPEGADAGDIAVAWPAWFEANRDVIGSDPDVIHPGQVLTAPDHRTEEDA